MPSERRFARRRPLSGFNLIGLLVVIVVIGVLAPKYATARSQIGCWAPPSIHWLEAGRDPPNPAGACRDLGDLIFSARIFLVANHLVYYGMTRWT